MARSRSAVVEAARTLFLRQGYAGTTMEDIAAAAGLTKRTVYNNYPDKRALFTLIVVDVTAFADAFVTELRHQFASGMTDATLKQSFDELGRRLALGIVRPEVVAMRRLLIGEAREFPELASQYFDRAPGQVLHALAAGFRRLSGQGLLKVTNPSLAAAQFAFLVAGAALDRAMLTGAIPARARILENAREGVTTFLSRYAAPSPRHRT